MYFPTPYRDPPQWYWKMPLRWRQRYCRWFVWKWEAAYRLCTNVLSRRVLLHCLPEAMAFAWGILREDLRRAGKGEMRYRQVLDVPVAYLVTCLRLWYGRAPMQATGTPRDDAN